MVRGAGLGRFPLKRKSYIGLIDLLMPEKTHARSLRCRCKCGHLLELFRRPVSQRGMQETIKSERVTFQIARSTSPESLTQMTAPSGC